MSFDLPLLLTGTYHDWLVTGLLTSFELAGISLLVAFPIALLVAMLRLAPSRICNWAGTFYVDAIRNVPLLAHMLFWYFGAPELLPDGIKQALYSSNIEFISATVGLSLYSAAYMAEDIRSGIRVVSAGQGEAARALGFGFIASMRFIILPQALPGTVPPLISQTLNLWKNTSVATVIGVAELMHQAAKVESNTFRSAEAFAFATAAYLAGSLLLMGAGQLYRHRHPVRNA